MSELKLEIPDGVGVNFNLQYAKHSAISFCLPATPIDLFLVDLSPGHNLTALKADV